jgi:hypothetical protein
MKKKRASETPLSADYIENYICSEGHFVPVVVTRSALNLGRWEVGLSPNLLYSVVVLTFILAFPSFVSVLLGFTEIIKIERFNQRALPSLLAS